MSSSSPQQAAWLPKLVIAPSFVLSLLFIYGLMAWNGYLSMSASRILPNYDFVGLQHYVALMDSDRFRVAMTNMAVFGFCFIGGAMALPFFVLVTGFPAIVELLGAEPQVAFGANLTGLVLMAILVVAFGALSDRIGRRPILMAGTLGVFFLCVPGVALLWDPTDAWRVYLAQILAIVPVSAIGATAWKKRSFTSILRTM